jgi:hypothetical protein
MFVGSSDRDMRKDRKDTYTRKGGTMTEAARQPKDKNYNLISVSTSHPTTWNPWRPTSRAQSEGDQELVEFFNAVLENNLEAAQRAKETLVPRFQSEQE